ncbi:MAG: TIGR04063 family PEP-CTERM/XrtA system glycosyltransferase [Pseudomonadota bacterium]
MRVLHVLDHSLPLHSGYSFRTRAIIEAQLAAGLDVRAITGQRHELASETKSVLGAVETIDGLTFHRTCGVPSGPPVLSQISEMAALAAAIKTLSQEWRPDVIHAHSPALCGGAAWRAANALGVPLVYEIRAFWEDAAVGNGTGKFGSARYFMTRALETQIAERADALFTISQGLRDDLIARGVAGGKIGVMPNGVDLGLFGEAPVRDGLLAEYLGLASDAPVLGYVGSFYDYEGIDDLIAALPMIRDRHPGTRLLLVGGGPCEEAWRAAAEKLPEPEAVIFTGRVPHNEVERYYSLMDVVVYPRKASRLTELVTPLKPLEAMAQRRLVAASNVAGHRELISDGVTGTLFVADDPSACASALSELLTARDTWDEMRRAAAAHVRERHDWSANAARYASVYRVLLAQHRRGKELVGEGQGRDDAGVQPHEPHQGLNA